MSAHKQESKRLSIAVLEMGRLGLIQGSHQDNFVTGYFQAMGKFCPRVVELETDEAKGLMASGWVFSGEYGVWVNEFGKECILLFPPPNTYEELL